MDYVESYLKALTNTLLVSEYDRLTKSNLGECLNSMKSDGVDYEINLRSGRIESELLKFDKFFYQFIWSRIENNH